MSWQSATKPVLLLLMLSQTGCATERLWKASTTDLDESVARIRTVRVGADGSIALEADVAYRGDFTFVQAVRYIVFRPDLLTDACRRVAADRPGARPLRVVLDGRDDNVWMQANTVPYGAHAANAGPSQLPEALRLARPIGQLTRESLPYGTEAVIVPYRCDGRDFLLWIKPPIPYGSIQQTPNRLALALLTAPTLLLDGATLPLQFLGAMIFLRDA
jgi:hypothetical protein